MPHSEFNRILPDADTAVLFIHGIAGTPKHFMELIPLVQQVPEHFTVNNILLDGHGKTVDDFAGTSMEKWKAQVEAKIQELSATHKNLIVVAHSMGTLFSIQQAIAHPERISALFLLASPLKLFLKPKAITNPLKVYSGKISSSDQHRLAGQASFGMEVDKRIWKYLRWIPRYMELFTEIKRTRKLVGELTTSCQVYQSRHDEMVSVSTYKILSKNTKIRTHVLENSTHYCYGEEDHEFLLSEFRKLIAEY